MAEGAAHHLVQNVHPLQAEREAVAVVGTCILVVVLVVAPALGRTRADTAAAHIPYCACLFWLVPSDIARHHLLSCALHFKLTIPDWRTLLHDFVRSYASLHRLLRIFEQQLSGTVGLLLLFLDEAPDSIMLFISFDLYNFKGA